MRQPNPYRPGADHAPGVLAGRGGILDAAVEAMDEAALGGRTPRPLVLVGPRRVGKSVVLGEIATMAADRYGWLTVHVAVRPGASFIAAMVERLGEVQAVLEEAAPGSPSELQALAARLGAFGVADDGDVDGHPGAEPAEAAADRALTDACQAAAARTSGVLLSIDDLHLAPAGDVGDLAAVLDRHAADDWPLVVVVARRPTVGSPEVPVPYLDRGERLEVGLLAPEDAAHALRGPAASAGRPLSAAGAALLAEASGGHPYAVQVLGDHAWCRSDGAPAMTVEHAAAALIPAEATLADGLYTDHWHDASPEEQAYLVTVARLLDGATSVTRDGVVAAHVGGTPEELSEVADRVVGRGALVAADRTVRFPVPGMATWVNAR